MFCRKNRKYYFAKKWGYHSTLGTPGIDGPDNDILQEAYKRFRIVLEERDKLVFEDRLSTLTQYVLQASATKRFSKLLDNKPTSML